MIVGHGLIARELHAQGATGGTFLAAGVSDSQCSDPDEYERDRDRLVAALRAGTKPFVYFSTCAIYGPETAYTRHKQALERLVLERDGLVLRLSNVVGRDGPEHQLVPFLHRKIMDGERIRLQRKARRNIVDVIDVAHIAILRTGDSGIANIAATQDHSVREIVIALMRTTGQPAFCYFVDGGESYSIPDSLLTTDKTYMPAVIERYFGHSVSARAAAA